MLTVSRTPVRLWNTTRPEVLTRPSRVRVSEAGTAEAYTTPFGRSFRIDPDVPSTVQAHGATVLKLIETFWPVAIARERWSWIVWTRFSEVPRSCCDCE